MSSTLFKALAGAALLAAAAPHAAADVVDCPDVEDIVDGELCSSIPAALVEGELDPAAAMEVTSNEFLVLPDAPAGSSADLSFSFIRDDGAFQYEFGFCVVSSIDAALLNKLRTAPETVTEDDRFDFADQCLSNINQVFADANTRDSDATASASDQLTATIADVPVPAELIFAIFPDTATTNTFDEYNALDAADRRAAWDSYEDKPLFSESPANPGGLDQLAIFCESGRALLQWEDVTRLGGGTRFGPSDEDFGDLAFRADFEIIAPPPPSECGADCDSAVSVAYAEGMTATASGEKCATLCFDCA